MLLKTTKYIATIAFILLALLTSALTIQQFRHWQKPSENVQGWHHADWMGFVASPSSQSECLNDELQPIAYSLLPSKLWLDFNIKHLDIQSIEPDAKDKDMLQAAILAAPDAEKVDRRADSYYFARSQAAWDFNRSEGEPPSVICFAYDPQVNHLFVYFRPNEWQLACFMPVPVPALLRTHVEIHEDIEYKIIAFTEDIIVPYLTIILSAITLGIALIWGIDNVRLRKWWFIFWVAAYIPLVVGYTYWWLGYYQPKHLGLGFGLIAYPIVNMPVILCAIICSPLIFRSKEKR